MSNITINYKTPLDKSRAKLNFIDTSYDLESIRFSECVIFLKRQYEIIKGKYEHCSEELKENYDKGYKDGYNQFKTDMDKLTDSKNIVTAQYKALQEQNIYLEKLVKQYKNQGDISNVAQKKPVAHFHSSYLSPCKSNQIPCTPPPKSSGKSISTKSSNSNSYHHSAYYSISSNKNSENIRSLSSSTSSVNRSLQTSDHSNHNTSNIIQQNNSSIEDINTTPITTKSNSNNEICNQYIRSLNLSKDYSKESVKEQINNINQFLSESKNSKIHSNYLLNNNHKIYETPNKNASTTSLSHSNSVNCTNKTNSLTSTYRATNDNNNNIRRTPSTKELLLNSLANQKTFSNNYLSRDQYNEGIDPNTRNLNYKNSSYTYINRQYYNENRNKLSNIGINSDANIPNINTANKKIVNNGHSSNINSNNNINHEKSDLLSIFSTLDDSSINNSSIDQDNYSPYFPYCNITSESKYLSCLYDNLPNVKKLSTIESINQNINYKRRQYEQEGHIFNSNCTRNNQYKKPYDVDKSLNEKRMLRNITTRKVTSDNNTNNIQFF